MITADSREDLETICRTFVAGHVTGSGLQVPEFADLERLVVDLGDFLDGLRVREDFDPDTILVCIVRSINEMSRILAEMPEG